MGGGGTSSGPGRQYSPRSAAVYTATTPGRARAADASTLESRAWACWLRRNATCSRPSSRTSSTKSARPVRSRASSLRRTRWPITLGAPGRATGESHGRDDVLVTSAAAQIPGERLADLALVRIGMVAQERDERHEDARRAEAALQPMGLAERRLERTASPSNSTVQAPHTPCSHPTCVPVSPSSWRRKSERSSRGSTARAYRTPLTVTAI